MAKPLPDRWANGGPADETEFMKSMVHVSIDHDTSSVRFEVDLGGLPSPHYTDGNEVIVRFHADDFNNEQTFYTDSNGLAMQKRVLNYRPSFNITDYYLESNITGNYYPVTSAIQIRDEKNGNRMTVMNDKTQGGSSLEPGTIELMQNRLLPQDDGKGQDDHLIEKDSYGNTIRVRATYHLVFEWAKHTETQRKVTQMVHDPAQIFFSSYFSVKALENKPEPKATFSEKIMAAGVKGTVRYTVVPKAANHFDIRLENLADLEEKGKWREVNIRKLAMAFYEEANPKAATKPKIDFSELSLTGNQPLAKLMKDKIKWKTVDDHKLESKMDFSFDGSKVKLEP